MLELNKIYLGDCLKVMKDIDDKSIDMILCDLPYGTTQNKWDSIIPLDLLWLQYNRIIKDNGAIVLTAAQPFATDLIYTNKEMFRYDMVWDKELPVGHLNANRMPLRQHELILVFYKKLPTYNPQKKYDGKKYHSKYKLTENVGGNNYGVAKSIDNSEKNAGYKYPTSIIKFKKDNSVKVVHPTQKPLALFKYLIKTYTNEGEIILDNCIGGGTTAISAIDTKRNFIGVEKDLIIFNTAVARVKKHIRQGAQLELTNLMK